MTERHLIEQLVPADLDGMQIQNEAHRKKLIRFAKSFGELEFSVVAPKNNTIEKVFRRVLATGQFLKGRGQEIESSHVE